MRANHPCSLRCEPAIRISLFKQLRLEREIRLADRKPLELRRALEIFA